MRPRRALPVLTLLLVGILLGCLTSSGEGRILLLALDGVDPAVIDLLMSEGKLPNFARLRQEGSYGRLASRKPLLSPVVWTTIATGKTPDEHQIGHFVAINQTTGEQLPVTSQMRKTKALWNMLSDAGKGVAVVGWWATWPAETVKGAIVSDHLCYHFLFEDGFSSAPGDMAALTFPPELAPELTPMVKRPGDLSVQEASPFIDVSAEEFGRPFDFDDEIGHFKWALATAETHHQIGLHLWEREKPDLMMVYIEGTDSISHLFGHLFRAADLSGDLAQQQRRYGRAVEEMYLYADRLVGDFIEVMDGRTTLVVLSDHGFNLGRLPEDPSKLRDMRRVSEKHHSPHGILYMYGRSVKPGLRLSDPTILDVAPTVLALAGMPAALDMPGRVLTEALREEPPRRIATYETGPRGEVAQEEDPGADPMVLERLRSLGYLATTSPAGDRNLAAVLFESGRLDEAAEAYLKLVEESPDDGSLRTSLAGVLGALGRYDEALEHIQAALEIQPLNPEAYHNRAVLHERRGNTEEAVRDYQTALRYNPQYEPSRQALRRLGAAVDPLEPRSDAERLAFLIAQQASEAARRGNYSEAMQKLDEAKRIAPRYALVYQYRSNVAYLMGDLEGAIEALEKGLEIEPDNALFQENLRRIQKKSP